MSAPERLAIFEAREDAIARAVDAMAAADWTAATYWAHRAWGRDRLLRLEVARRGRARG